VEKNFKNHEVAEAEALCGDGALRVVGDGCIGPGEDDPELRRRDVFRLLHSLVRFKLHDMRYLDIEIRFINFA